MSGWAWLGLYFLSQFSVPAKKKCRGLFTRYILARIIPPRRWWKSAPGNDTYRYFLWMGVNLPLQYTVLLHNDALGEAIFWGGYILMLLDDYLFGDDNSWKKFKEWAGNKIKWKMELPQPAIDRGGGTA